MGLAVGLASQLSSSRFIRSADRCRWRHAGLDRASPQTGQADPEQIGTAGPVWFARRFGFRTCSESPIRADSLLTVMAILSVRSR